MTSLIQPGDAWWLWAAMISGVAVCIYLEQNFKWAAKTSGPGPGAADWNAAFEHPPPPNRRAGVRCGGRLLVPIAIPLLLFRANVVRIVRESGPMFRAFHVASLGTGDWSFCGRDLFSRNVPRVPEVAGS
jgi:hypothetical protein